MPASKPSNAISTTNNRSPSRKGSKPQVEKKRRARINKSLAELQDLIVDTDRTKSGSRIEKADILEMTVRHLRSIRGKGHPHPPATPESHSQPQADSSSEKSIIDWNRCSLRRFNKGYVQCISDISGYLMEFDKLDWNLHNGLKSHLMDRLRDFNGQRTVDVDSPRVDVESSKAALDSDNSNSDCSSTLSPEQSYVGFTPESNNTVVHVIPGRLANGQLAFLLPHNSYDSFPKWDGRDYAYISTAECCSPIGPPSNACCGSSAVADNGSCVSQRRFRSSIADFTMVRPNYDSMWRPW